MAQGSPVRLTALDGTQDKTIKATTAYYHGFTIRETAGSTAVVRLRAGSVSGTILETIYLQANGCAGVLYDAGILADGGIYEDWVSGAYEGTVRWSA